MIRVRKSLFLSPSSNDSEGASFHSYENNAKKKVPCSQADSSKPTATTPSQILSLMRHPLNSKFPMPRLPLSDTESELRSLFDKITSSFSYDPFINLPEFLGLDLTNLVGGADKMEIFRLWIQKLMNEIDCPDLRRRIEEVLRKGMKSVTDSSNGSKLKRNMESLSNEIDNCSGRRTRMKSLSDIEELKGKVSVKSLSDLSSGCELKRKEGLEEMLVTLKGVAVDPHDESRSDKEWEGKMLRARKALFLCSLNSEEFPYQQQKTCKILRKTSRDAANQFLENPQSESIGGFASCKLPNQPRRRSQRTLLKLDLSELPRQRIPIGPSFQADIPDWTGPPNNEGELDEDKEWHDYRRLGTQIWPTNGVDRQTSGELIGRGRPDLCDCTSPRSVDCIRFHVNKARHRLRSDLGSAFFDLGFDEMGEEVAKSWTQEEQLRFDDIVRENPPSEDKSFWQPMLKYFTYKSRQAIVSYYFNVFVLRWMSIRTRLQSGTVDTDDDENM